jgi:hypothetical protein
LPRLQVWDFKKAREKGVIRLPLWSCSEIVAHRCPIVYMIFVPGLASYPDQVEAKKPEVVEMTAAEIEEMKAESKLAVSRNWNAGSSDDDGEPDDPHQLGAAKPPEQHEDDGMLFTPVVASPARSVLSGIAEADEFPDEGETSPLTPSKKPPKRGKTLYAGSKSRSKAKRKAAADKALLESMLPKESTPATVDEPAAKGQLITFSEDNIMIAWDVDTHERLWIRHFSSRVIGHELVDRRELWLTFADTTLVVMDAFTGAAVSLSFPC